MNVTFELSADVVVVFDFVEIVIRVKRNTCANPFTDVEVIGEFGLQGKSATGALHLTPVDGFCDAADGSLYRVRFMPSAPGMYAYTVTILADGAAWQSSGAFEARDAGRRGVLRVDPAHPFHFIWEGTGEHYYYNSTTAYGLLGFRDEQIIRDAIDRLRRLRINRIRVGLESPRVASGMAWYEPVYPSAEFDFAYGPWVAARPDDLADPGFDMTRFDVAYWQKVERMLVHARDCDMAVSVIFYVDGARPGVDPFGKARMGGLDEQRYYRYAAARLAAYSNVMWDVTNEYQLFRTAGWAQRMGAFLKACDPYGHLTSIHGHPDFEFRTAGWVDFVMYQCWDEFGGYDFMLKQRRAQQASGRIIPQVNEEYGYEDHYPQWGGSRISPARSADNRRRLAWEIVMAGGYQTTGECAGREGIGGWINGRGGDETMLTGYGYLMDFITSFDWWNAEPRPDLVAGGARCLAAPNGLLALYSPDGGEITMSAPVADYRIAWFNPRTGAWLPAVSITHPGGALPLACPDRAGDWACMMHPV